MIKIRLRQMIKRLERQTGTRVTYAWLSERTGFGKSYLEELGSDKKQRAANPTLDVINALCEALSCTPCELLEYSEEPDESERRTEPETVGESVRQVREPGI